MELDNIKEMWFLMDQKLKKQEIINEAIINEMMQTKANKSLNRLIISEIIGFIICLLAIPLVINIYKVNQGKFISWDITMFFCGIVCVLYCIWGSYKMYGLFKIDFSESIALNTYYINRYDIQMKYEKIFTIFFLVPMLAILCISAYAQANVSIELWLFMIVMFLIVGSISFLSYKRLYPKQIRSIKQSLEKLKELEEELE